MRPRPCLFVSFSVNDRHGFLLAGQHIPCQPLTNHLAHGDIETVSIFQWLAVIALAEIVAEHLLIEVAEQVEGFHADIGSVEPALNQLPEILQAVGVDAAANVFNGVVNYLMLEFVQPVV